MKNKLLSIIGITVILLAVISLQTNSISYSSQGLPYPNIPENKENSPSQCLQSVANEVYLMRSAWNANLALLMEQEKPTSEMVDDAFSDMRTYKCWLKYLCQSVLFSGGYDSNPLFRGKLMSPQQFIDEEAKGIPFGEYLDKIPGCVSPDKVVIPGTKLKFMPYCTADNSFVDKFSVAQANNFACQNLIQLEFSDISDDSLSKSDVGKVSSKLKETIQNKSSAIVGVVSALKRNSADQKSVVLQSKLQSILSKLNDMESHMVVLKEAMERFDQKLACVAPQCD